MDIPRFLRSSLQIDLEQNRKELLSIVNAQDDSERTQRLRALATQLGASIIDLYKGCGDAPDAQVINNIQLALQTKAMIAAVEASANYVFVTMGLTVIAFLSMVISLLTVLRA